MFKKIGTNTYSVNVPKSFDYAVLQIFQSMEYFHGMIIVNKAPNIIAKVMVKNVSPVGELNQLGSHLKFAVKLCP